MAKILLVEDDKSLREIYGVRLMAEGYEIISAGDGEEALAIAIKERPALIVSDVMMPKISGFDMLDILRSTTETKNIKVIMMTALSSEDQRARGESLGADRYLVKSQVGIEDVVRTVHDVLGDGLPGTTNTPTFPPAPAAAPTPPATPPTPAEPTSSSKPFSNPAEAPAAPLPTPTPAPAPVINTPPEVPSTPPAAAPAPMPAAPVTVTPEPAAPTPAPATDPTTPTTDPGVIQGPAPINDIDDTPQPSTPPPIPTSSSTLGDRVINPLPSAANLTPAANDIAEQMNRELSEALKSDAAAVPPPGIPAAQPVPPTPNLPPPPPTPPAPTV